jgi:hypothetical protein
MRQLQMARLIVAVVCMVRITDMDIARVVAVEVPGEAGTDSWGVDMGMGIGCPVWIWGLMPLLIALINGKRLDSAARLVEE